jgi:translation initiation factor 3 subunit H
MMDLKFVKEDAALEEVHVAALVALKITKHCKESLPTPVSGSLLGLDVGNILEVTNCFPIPDKGEEDASGANYNAMIQEYQIEMMKCLREVNVDNNTVGWYQSSYLGSHYTEMMLEQQFNYQIRPEIRRAVVLVYDPLRTSHGELVLKAYKLSEKFVKLYKNKTFKKESLLENNFTFLDIFEEIPVKLFQSPLMRMMSNEMTELISEGFLLNYDSLELQYSQFLEKNLEVLIDCVNDLQSEQNKYQNWLRQVARLQQLQQQFLQKRKLENAQRKLNNEPLLPETLKELEVEEPQLFKIPTEPSLLETLLIANQINNHCEQMIEFGGQAITKLYLFSSLREKSQSN